MGKTKSKQRAVPKKGENKENVDELSLNTHKFLDWLCARYPHDESLKKEIRRLCQTTQERKKELGKKLNPKKE